MSREEFEKEVKESWDSIFDEDIPKDIEQNVYNVVWDIVMDNAEYNEENIDSMDIYYTIKSEY